MNARHQRVLIAGALCVSALVIDKVILGPPAGAAATEPGLESLDVVVESDATIAGDLPSDAGATVSMISSRLTLADRLARVELGAGEVGEPASPFARPESWFRSVTDDRSDAEPTDDDPHAPFLRSWELQSTIQSREGTAGVIMNTIFVAVGEEVDGYRLVSVGQRAAVFESDLGQVILEIPIPEVGRSGRPTRPGRPPVR